MAHRKWYFSAPALAVMFFAIQAAAGADSFVRLTPLPTPEIAKSADKFKGGNYAAANLLDGKPATEFAASGKGDTIFVEFDFGKLVRVGGFRHQDRNDTATIAASELIFFDAAGKQVATVPVRHVNQPSGITMLALPDPVETRRVRWNVTKVGNHHRTVGGAEIAFYAAGAAMPTPSEIGFNVQDSSIVTRQDGRLMQALRITLDYPYATALNAELRVDGQATQPINLSFGQQTLAYSFPMVETPRPLRIELARTGVTVAASTVTLKPPHKETIYILPHSHTDIGYTEIQTEIEDKQVNNLLLGMDYARRTAAYPPGARFVWNVEVLWAADLYLHRLGEAQRRTFMDALKSGQIALNGMYLNELTGLCRPEELLRLFRYATQLREQTGTVVDSAMISDVPGYTWGTVSAMVQAGIKYFSVAPNYFDRIGDILVQWENKPFYWVGPSGQDKVLVWIPYKGYAMSHMQHKLTPEFVEQYMAYLERTGYPYDIAYMRWAGHGDNATPDPAICDFVKEWSASHEWPKFIISSTGEAFRALEARYGSKLPRVRGDWTPYWEDGAGSSALETAMNRASSDRLIQAEALWALQRSSGYPAASFEEAWRNVLLYSEHTWGAFCSVTEPQRKETLEQWGIKSSYATTADRQSRERLSQALARGQIQGDEGAIDVFNTTSWPRTDLVMAPKYLAEGLNRVVDAKGKTVPSQRLSNGDLVFLARDVPPLASMRYHLQEGNPYSEAKGQVKAHGAIIENGLVHVRIDEQTGGIIELRARDLAANLADTSSGHALNDYLYLVGDDTRRLQYNGPVKISIKEKGPLVASLLIESEAPGCHSLQREVRLAAGQDHVQLFNLVDKRRIMANDYKSPEGKESLNFAFPFNVPGGQMRLEIPFGVIRPDADLLPSACKNWFTVGRWADVSNSNYGVTWVTLDAPLVQVGGITATMLNSQTNPDVWRKAVQPTQQLYSWAMNNHWGTNYRAFQEGPVTFRFILRPHGRLDLAEASRLAIGLSQPLLATGARGTQPAVTPRLTLDAPNVLVTGLKPSDDGKAMIVRLWEAAGRDTQVKLGWAAPVPKGVWLSDLSERPLKKVDGAIALPGWGVATIRAELVRHGFPSLHRFK